MKFEMPQILRRFGLPQNASRQKIKEKIGSAGYVIEDTYPEKDKKFLTIESDIDYSPEDILYCHGSYFDGNEVIQENTVYTPVRNNIRLPKGMNKADSVILEVIKIIGRVN